MRLRPGRDRTEAGSRGKLATYVKEGDVSILGAMNRRGAKGRSLLFACLVAAATLPSGVVAFQQSGKTAPDSEAGRHEGESQ